MTTEERRDRFIFIAPPKEVVMFELARLERVTAERISLGDPSTKELKALRPMMAEVQRLYDAGEDQAGWVVAQQIREACTKINRAKQRNALSRNQTRSNAQRQREAAERRRVCQTEADQVWQEKPRLTKEAVGQHIYKTIKPMIRAKNGTLRRATVRTIRGMIKKPGKA